MSFDQIDKKFNKSPDAGKIPEPEWWFLAEDGECSGSSVDDVLCSTGACEGEIFEIHGAAVVKIAFAVTMPDPASYVDGIDDEADLDTQFYEFATMDEADAFVTQRKADIAALFNNQGKAIGNETEG